MADVAQPLVTVLIPTVNRPSLTRAVESVLAQTYAPLEVVVIDDESEPPVDAASFADERVRVVRLDRRQGAAAARNAGLAASTSEVVALLDDDDWWRPPFLERAVPVLMDAPEDVAFVDTGFDLWHEGKQVRRHLPDLDRRMPADILVRASIWPSTLVIRRRALDSVRGFDENIHRFEDLDLYLRLLAAGWVFKPVREVLADRTWHVMDPASVLADYQHTDALSETHFAPLEDRDRQRARSFRALDYGVLYAQTGRAREARRWLWKAWRINPRHIRPLTQLPRTVVGERIWARPALWSHVLRGRLARRKE
jgi:glycosyltransferase involved in cell wall biosynthesis